MKVRCNNCMRIFDEKDILTVGGDYDDEFCPFCGYHGGLMDMMDL